MLDYRPCHIGGEERRGNETWPCSTATPARARARSRRRGGSSRCRSSASSGGCRGGPPGTSSPTARCAPRCGCRSSARSGRRRSPSSSACRSRGCWPASVPGRGAVRALCTLSMVLPPVVGGVALFFALSSRPFGQYLDRWFGITLPFTTTGVVLAQTFVAMPFLVMTVEAALRQLDPRYEEAARTLGRIRWYVFRRVTLPAIRPALVAGAVLAWARALGEFGATITFAGNFPGTTQTMPLAVYLALESDPEEALVLSLVLIAVSFAVLVGLASAGSAGPEGARRREPARPRSSCESGGSTSTSSSRSNRARSSHCSGPTGQGRRRCCACSPASRRSTRAGSRSTAPCRRSGRRHVRAARAAADRHRVPGLPALRPPRRARERRLRPPGRGMPNPEARRGRRRGWPGGPRRGGPPSPGSCPAASRSGSPWPERWPPSPGSCCWTNRSPHSTRAPGGRCVGGWAVICGLRRHAAARRPDPVDAYALADRVVVLEAGRVAQSARMAEVAAHSRSRYIADLVGTNLFSGRLVDHVLTTTGGCDRCRRWRPGGRPGVCRGPTAGHLVTPRASRGQPAQHVGVHRGGCGSARRPRQGHA